MVDKPLMLHWNHTPPFATLLFAIVSAAALAASPDKTRQDHAILEIQAVLNAQQAAWNQGDIETFMSGYQRADTTTFVSGEEITRGWQTVFDRYKAKYSSREQMGTLAFSDVEIEMLGPDSAVALGRWELKRTKDNPHGRFTLIFRKTADGWKIVHDHTSAG